MTPRAPCCKSVGNASSISAGVEAFTTTSGRPSARAATAAPHHAVGARVRCRRRAGAPGQKSECDAYSPRDSRASVRHAEDVDGGDAQSVGRTTLFNHARDFRRGRGDARLSISEFFKKTFLFTHGVEVPARFRGWSSHDAAISPLRRAAIARSQCDACRLSRRRARPISSFHKGTNGSDPMLRPRPSRNSRSSPETEYVRAGGYRGPACAIDRSLLGMWALQRHRR